MATKRALRILVVSDLRHGYPMRQRYDAICDIAETVYGIDYSKNQPSPFTLLLWKKVSYWLFRHHIGCFPVIDNTGTNKHIIEAAERSEWDILWLDRALVVDKNTLERVRNRQPNCIIVGFSHDDMIQRHNQSKQFLEHLKCYNAFYTTKSYNVKELERLGCKRCKFINNSFDPRTHRHHEGGKKTRYSVGFVGHWEKEREQLFRILVDNGIKVHVWGGGWHNCRLKHKKFICHAEDVIGDAYAQTLCSIDINLCLLRKANRDLQTTRSIEIPACGAFMLGERTPEHQELFREGEEADFFDSAEELIHKIRFYLNNPDRLKQVALAGHSRCLIDRYSNQDRINDILDDLL